MKGQLSTFFPASYLLKQQVTEIVSIFHRSLRTIFKGDGGISTGFTLRWRDTSNTLISCFGPWILSTSNNYLTFFLLRAFSLCNCRPLEGQRRETRKKGRRSNRIFDCCQVKTFKCD